jgi:hypothetical protein
MDETQMENENLDGLPLRDYIASVFEKKNEVTSESIRKLNIRKVGKFSKYMIPIYSFINRHPHILKLYNKIRLWNRPKGPREIISIESWRNKYNKGKL